MIQSPSNIENLLESCQMDAIDGHNNHLTACILSRSCSYDHYHSYKPHPWPHTLTISDAVGPVLGLSLAVCLQHHLVLLEEEVEFGRLIVVVHNILYTRQRVVATNFDLQKE